MPRYSELLCSAIKTQLGVVPLDLERTYHTYARQRGDWVYAWVFRLEGQSAWVGCYETMADSVSAIKRGARLRLSQPKAHGAGLELEVIEQKP